MKGKKSGTTPKGKGARTPRPYFFAILVLLPFLILAAIEGGLRLAGVERTAPLFLRHDLNGTTYLQVNPRIGGRFFPPAMGAGIPVPNFQMIPERKPPGTRRILCLGESTTAGFPFPAHGAFPALLQTILSERRSDLQWEVTNLGLTGISSSIVAALIDEMLDTGPDALVVYLGHNEFYGMGGVGSRGLAGSLTQLRSLRIYRLMERLLARPRESSAGRTLMERMAARSNIDPASPLRRIAARRFSRNLDRILDAASRRNVQVVLCEVVSNERDLYPFGPGIAAPSLRWHSWNPSADEAIREIPALDALVAKDSLAAGARYLRGAARLAAGMAGAPQEMRAARNEDAVPFRAPDPIDEIIRHAARSRGIPLVPLEQIFRVEAPAGIPGGEAFVEHLHPTFLGSVRIASAVADVLLQRPISRVGEEEAGRWLALSDLTRLDLAFADARIAQLLGGWPYTRRDIGAAPFPYRVTSLVGEAGSLLRAAGMATTAESMGRSGPDEERIVRDLLRKRLDLLEAHRLTAQRRLESADVEGASRELRAYLRLYPVDAQAWTYLAEMRLRAGDRSGARNAAQAALGWSPSSARARTILQQAESSETGH